MRKPSTAHRSRRAPPLKDSDYDHEINLVDHAAETVTPQALSPEPGQQPGQPADQQPTPTIEPQPAPESVAKQEQQPEAESDSGEGPSSSQKAPTRSRSPRHSTSSASARSTRSRRSKEVSKKSASQESLTGDAAVPQLEVTGEILHESARTVVRRSAKLYRSLTGSRTYTTRWATTPPSRYKWHPTPEANPRDRHRHTIRE